ncbi:MAG: hypothetical protein ACRD1Z_20245 [Vicinamibacteria bacterium]
MICGYCSGFSAKRVDRIEAHWRLTGCPWARPVWVRYFESRTAGHSGRRILHEAFPDLWPSDPMDEEARERLQEADARRKASGVMRRPYGRRMEERRAAALSRRG